MSDDGGHGAGAEGGDDDEVLLRPTCRASAFSKRLSVKACGIGMGAGAFAARRNMRLFAFLRRRDDGEPRWTNPNVGKVGTGKMFMAGLKGGACSSMKIEATWHALLTRPPLATPGMPSSPDLPWRHVACPPHPTSLGDTWHALLTRPPLATPGMPSSADLPWYTWQVCRFQ